MIDDDLVRIAILMRYPHVTPKCSKDWEVV